MTIYDLNAASLNAYLAGKHAARRDYWSLQAIKGDIDRVACETFAAAAEAAHQAALTRAVKMQALAAARDTAQQLRQASP